MNIDELLELEKKQGIDEPLLLLNYDVVELENELNKYNKKHKITNDSAVISILNNCKIYNDLITNYEIGRDTKSLYLMTQLNSQIFKALTLFEIVPRPVRVNAAEKKLKLSKYQKNSG